MDMFNPLVSIIIPVYNGANYLREAIDSVLGQSYNPIEVLVINDGSQDDGQTERIALSYGDKLRYFTKPNGGVASALNLGIEQMRGEYFSWLSHDDVYFPDKVSAQIELLSHEEDKTAIVLSGWAVIDGKGAESYQVKPLNTYTKQQLGTPLFALLHGQVNGCSMLIHKSHFERAGVFDEHLPMTQDFDLWFRMMRDARVICHTDALSMTRVHDQQDSRQRIHSHADESDALWIHMMESLTDQEKIAMDGTVYEFYKNVYQLLLSCSSYRGAIAHAKRKASAELRKSNGGISSYLLEYRKILLPGYYTLFKKALWSLREFGLSSTIKRVSFALHRKINS